VVTKVVGTMLVSKPIPEFDIEAFNVKKLNFVAVKELYQVNVSRRCVETVRMLEHFISFWFFIG
jgi:hypothetical protein